MNKITNYLAALAVVLAAAVNSGCPSRRQKPLENRFSPTSIAKVSEEDTKKAVFNELPGYTIKRVTNTPNTTELMPVIAGDSAAFYNPVNRGVYLVSNCSEKTDLVFGSKIEKPDNAFVTQLIGGKDYLVIGAVHQENGKEIYRVHVIDPRTKKNKVIFETSENFGKYVIRDFTSSSENEIALEQLPISDIQKLYGIGLDGRKRELGRESLDYHQTKNKMNQLMHNKLIKDTRRVTDFYGNEHRGVVAVKYDTGRDLYSYVKKEGSSQPASKHPNRGRNY